MAFFKNIGKIIPGVLGLKGVSRSLGLSSQNYPSPADKAMEYINRVPGQAAPYLNPFIQGGQGAEMGARNAYAQQYNQYANEPDLYQNLPDLYSNPGIDFNESPREYSEMARNPTEFIDKIMRSYSPSEGYRFKENRLLGAARNSAASGGFAGTREDQLQQADLVRNLLGEDMQQYLSNVLGVQGRGLTGEENRIMRLQEGLRQMLLGRERGQERGILGRERAQERRLIGQERALGNIGGLEESRAGRAFDAAKAFADLLAGNTAQQGNLAFTSQNQRNLEKDATRRNRLNMLSTVLGMVGGR